MCVIIIGAGPAGCEAAYRLAQAGKTVELIEKESETGGNLNNWYQLFPDRKQARDLNQSLRQNIQRPDIHLHLGNYPVKISRTENNKFTLELNDGALLKGDALLVTSGFRLFNARRKEEYGYGIYENVITSVELENFFINHHIATSTGQVHGRGAASGNKNAWPVGSVGSRVGVSDPDKAIGSYVEAEHRSELRTAFGRFHTYH